MFVINLPEADPWYNSALFTAVISTLSAIAALLLNEGLHNKRTRKKELESYISHLQIADDEVNFYLKKIQTLIVESEALMETIQNDGIGSPSFDLHLAFLEQSKIVISGFNRSREVISSLGEVHFELEHIRKKLKNIEHMVFNCEHPVQQRFKNALNQNYKNLIKCINGLSPKMTFLLSQLEQERTKTKNEIISLDLIHPIGFIDF
ncbi:hypothetical protein GCM10023213_44460 [Prosthecobacter algae]|uniref:Uncharacterized protein n=2 Tax=Prosthecobacter algae TaxID=1144682 RepID=A0ABP9PNJ2_9BACT